MPWQAHNTLKSVNRDLQWILLWGNCSDCTRPCDALVSNFTSVWPRLQSTAWLISVTPKSNRAEGMDRNGEVNNAAATVKLGQADRGQESWKKWDRTMQIKWIICELRATAYVIQSTPSVWTPVDLIYSTLIPQSLKSTPCLFSLTWADNGGIVGVDLRRYWADCCDSMPEVVCCNTEGCNECSVCGMQGA